MAFARRKTPYNIVELYEYAVAALGRRMRTVAEMKRLLRQRVAGQDSAETMVEVVVDKLKEQRYLNDTEYARTYSSLRRENDKLGRRRVITDLKTKGVHGDVIDKTVGEAYAGVNEEKLAREFLLRRHIKKPADQKQAAKVFRTLARAGFATRTIIGILKKWDVEDEVITALEAEAAE
ncbi:MAG: regulatory protein RecX [Terriglobales bacterium]